MGIKNFATKIIICLLILVGIDYLPVYAQKQPTKVTITKEIYDENGNKSTQTIVKEGPEADAIDIEGLANGQPYVQQFDFDTFGSDQFAPFSLEDGFMDLRSLFDSLQMGDFEMFGPGDWSFGDIMPYEESRKPRLGIQIQPLETQAGVLIVEVVEGSPAETAGLEVGDIILAIDGEEVDTPEDVVSHIQSSESESVYIDILRGDDHLSFEANLDAVGSKKELEIKKL